MIVGFCLSLAICNIWLTFAIGHITRAICLSGSEPGGTDQCYRHENRRAALAVLITKYVSGFESQALPISRPHSYSL